MDEELKVWTIDFPQMVSTSHKDAEFYFSRDQECIHTLFSRKFGFLCPTRRYSLKDIPIIKHLDKEVGASGCAKGKITEEEQALLAYVNERRDQETIEEDMEGEDENGDDAEIDEDSQAMEEGGLAPQEQDDDEAEDAIIGDIEEELRQVEGATTVDEKLAIKITPQEEEIQEDGEEEGEEEEFDLEAQMDRRKQMKELKRQAKSKKKGSAPSGVTTKQEIGNKQDDLAQPKAETAKNTGDGDEESADHQDSEDGNDTEFIKKALKKKYRPKKVFKSNKNHPKQLHNLVKDQMPKY